MERPLSLLLRALALCAWALASPDVHSRPLQTRSTSRRPLPRSNTRRLYRVGWLSEFVRAGIKLGGLGERERLELSLLDF